MNYDFHQTMNVMKMSVRTMKNYVMALNMMMSMNYESFQNHHYAQVLIVVPGMNAENVLVDLQMREMGHYMSDVGLMLLSCRCLYVWEMCGKLLYVLLSDDNMVVSNHNRILNDMVYNILGNNHSDTQAHNNGVGVANMT